MDFGVSLIGTLRNFGFTEAFSFFRHEAFQAKISAELAAMARLQFDSGMHPVGSFDAFGSNFNLKGILIVNPYFQVNAQVEAQATVSLDAAVQVTVTHPNFQYYFPAELGQAQHGSWGVSSQVGSVEALAKVDTEVGGDVIFTIQTSVGFDISLAFGGKQLVDTSIKLNTETVTDFYMGGM